MKSLFSTRRLSKGENETRAIDTIRQQLENGEHRHAVEVWDHAWSVEPDEKHPFTQARRFECGEVRE